MTETHAQQATHFGGTWTLEKLEILERYLDAYTTALKNQRFRLVYIDAFAGSGEVEVSSEDPDAHRLIRGSAKRAIGIGNRPFDKLVFVEKDAQSCRDLELLRRQNPSRNIKIEQANANDYLNRISIDWDSWRGVLFLDPFATEVECSTVARISQFNALDTWLLFPVSAIQRILPSSRTPDDVSPGWSRRLTTVYGDDSWRGLYRVSRQETLFGDTQFERDRGVDGLIRIYTANLKKLFGDRLLDRSRTLYNSKGSPLFEFLFCVGHERGIAPAKNIADHILKRI